MNEADWIAQAKKGEEAGFRDLLKRHKRAIFRFCYRLTQEPEEAEDIAQESFIRAFEHIGSYQPTGSFCGWICRMAYHEFINRYKKQQRHFRANEALMEELRYLASVNEERDTFIAGKSHLQKALEKLPEAYARVLQLRFMDEWPIEEIGRILQMPTSTVKTRMHRGRQLLVKAIMALERSPV